MGMIEGEIKYRKNPLGQCFENIGNRCGGIYGDWLLCLAALLRDSNEGFVSVWNQGLNWLFMQRDKNCISREDIDGLRYMGQALAEGNTETQINALLLEKAVLQGKITELSGELKNKSRIVLSLCGLGGILVVICLAL
jgi:stage III sporulation protein AB